ncbi:MAG TPA: molybdate ABC transporter substrate-binding protein [Terriglobales bacterium]|nr:molybdate ABC transporter substrate-binding protein [Terriglobales bacterium]
MKRLFFLFAIAILLPGFSTNVRAQGELAVLAPGPIREPFNKLVAQYEMKSGKKVKVTYAGGVPSRQQVAAGKGLDVDVLFAPFPDVLKTGNIDPKSATVVARVRLALAVKKGAPKPDISTPAAVKKTLLNAKSIASVDPAIGSVGGIAQACLDKLGIADQVKPKLQWVKTGGVVQDQVAKGETEIALGPYLSDMDNPGIDVVGALPPGASTPVDITGFISNSLKDTKDAKAFLAFLRSKEAAPIWEEAKVFPVTK